jgi:hypothetical protein
MFFRMECLSAQNPVLSLIHARLRSDEAGMRDKELLILGETPQALGKAKRRFDDAAFIQMPKA